MKLIRIIIVFLCLITCSAYAQDNPPAECKKVYRRADEGRQAEYKKDYKRAFQYYSEILNKDPSNPEANVKIGRLYYDGLGTERDFKKAFKHISIASKTYSGAQAFLAKLYMMGDGIEKNYRIAYYHANLSAENGDSYGQFLRGLMCYHGLGTTKNYNDAFKNIYASATQTSFDNRAQFFLATLYERGEGIKTNLQEAYTWYLIGKANLQDTNENPTDFTIIYKNFNSIEEVEINLDKKIDYLEKKLTRHQMEAAQIQAKNWLDAQYQEIVNLASKIPVVTTIDEY